MPGFLPDTSVMVAAVCTWHEHHELAAKELEQRFDQGETMIVAAPAVIEAYAVLTRLPSPHRLSAVDALSLLETNFISAAKTTALEAESYQTLLRQALKGGIVGGRTYDLVIAVCASKANVSSLLTFNASDFLSFSMTGLAIVIPGTAQ